MAALRFAATKHRRQCRKGKGNIPYINHPIEVAELLCQCGEDDTEVLMAALLHDTIEDTETSKEEIREAFGARVEGLVLELSDDKALPKRERKLQQVLHAAEATRDAKVIKLADKIMNVRDIGSSPPENWTIERKAEYLQWACDVVAGLRGVNQQLDAQFDEALLVTKSLLDLE